MKKRRAYIPVNDDDERGGEARVSDEREGGGKGRGGKGMGWVNEPLTLLATAMRPFM